MGDFPQFQQHMEGVHKVYYEYDILLAVNFIERSEKDTIIERVKRKVGGGGGEEEDVKEVRKTLEIKPAKPPSQGTVRQLNPFSKVTIEKISNKTDLTKDAGNSQVFLKQESIWEKAGQKMNFNFNKVPEKPILSPPGPTSSNKLQIIRIKSESSSVDSKNVAPTSAKLSMVKSQPTENHEENPIHNGDRLSCQKCKKKFSQLGKLKKHMAKKNDCEKVCGKCGKEFDMPGKLRQHMKMLKPCVAPKCNLCGKSFGSEKLYWHHRSRRISCVPLKCEDCPMEFTSKKLFKLHKERRRTCKKQTLNCTNCKKWFSPPKALGSHMNKEILCKKMIDCETCGMIVRESKFEKHSQGKRCNVPVDRKCKNCLRTFGTKASARQHYKRQAVNPNACRKRLECEKCGRRLRQELYERYISFLSFPFLSCFF